MLKTFDVVNEVVIALKAGRDISVSANADAHETAKSKLVQLGFDYGTDADWLVEDIRVNKEVLSEMFQICTGRISWIAAQIEKGIQESIKFYD